MAATIARDSIISLAGLAGATPLVTVTRVPATNALLALGFAAVAFFALRHAKRMID